MPQIGLGTGGIPHDVAIEVFIKAYLQGTILYTTYSLKTSYINKLYIDDANFSI